MKGPAIIAAAALAVAGFGLAPAHAANGGPTTAPMQVMVKPIGNGMQSAALMAPDAKIRGIVRNATEYALTPSGMTKLVSLFAPAQQQSIEKSTTYSEGYGEKLNARIESISKAWQQKYGSAFATSNDIELSNKTLASIQTQPPSHNNGNMESARVGINGAKGASNLQVPLVCENGDDWRINVPSSLTAEKLRDNLLSSLTEIDTRSAHWPSNEADAYRLVSHHVLAAVLDQPTPAHAQASALPKPAAAVVQQTSAVTAKPVSATSSNPWYEFWKW